MGKPAAPPPVPAAALAEVPRYYPEADLDRRITVRSTATSRVMATLPIRGPLPIGLGAVASAGHGLFFAAGVAPHSQAEQLYRFRVTAAGKVTGLTPVPGGRLTARQRVMGWPPRLAGRAWRSATARCGTATRPGPTG